jgi:hypothetical protein
LSDEAVTDALFLSGVRGTNASLRHRVTVEHNNWTLIEVDSPDQAAEAVKHMLQSDVTLLHAHWTSGRSAYSLYLCGILQNLLQEVSTTPEIDKL